MIIFTDGSYVPKHGGGWAALICTDIETTEISGGEIDTTNNRMEMLAVISALEFLESPQIIELYTDSRYVIDGITSWIDNWKIKNWKNIKNVDLWKRLDYVRNAHKITWIWVKGHSGNVGNEYVDKLAGASKGQLTVKIKTVKLK